MENKYDPSYLVFERGIPSAEALNNPIVYYGFKKLEPPGSFEQYPSQPGVAMPDVEHVEATEATEVETVTDATAIGEQAAAVKGDDPTTTKESEAVEESEEEVTE